MSPDAALTTFVSGAVIGSLCTYFIVTRERRVASRIRMLLSLGTVHKLDGATYRRSQDREELGDEKILSTYRWAYQHRERLKLNPELFAAERIVCDLLEVPDPHLTALSACDKRKREAEPYRKDSS